MSSFNRVVIMGNLANPPELRFLPGGDTAIVELAIAVNEVFKKDDKTVETVSFVDCTFFGRTAEVVNEFLRQGDPILVEGRLKQDRWEKEGKKRSKLKVVVEKMKLIGSKRSDNESEPTEEDPQLVGSNATSGDQQF